MDKHLCVTVHVIDNRAVATHVESGITATRDLGMNPTWPTPTEANDLIADAVREVMDLALYSMTGLKAER